MRHNLSAIWMVARREFTDQFRDWRIVVPMFILVTLFPFIADDMTRQAVNFMNRFGGSLILDHLIPFVVLVIGFFPLSFTLVVALESFVGEKERGTIEPLLSSPLEDRHMYLGKLLVGITTPLVFSYASIAIYLIMVSRRAVAFP
ncbi:MAG TPA: ABC transporter permease subunit, partial [Anaerolineales bacterium]